MSNRHSCDSSSSSIKLSSRLASSPLPPPVLSLTELTCTISSSGATVFAASGRYDGVILKYSFAIHSQQILFVRPGKLFFDPEDTNLLKYEVNFGKSRSNLLQFNRIIRLRMHWVRESIHTSLVGRTQKHSTLKGGGVFRQVLEYRFHSRRCLGPFVREVFDRNKSNTLCKERRYILSIFMLESSIKSINAARISALSFGTRKVPSADFSRQCFLIKFFR